MLIGNPLLSIGIALFLIGVALLIHSLLKERNRNIITSAASPEVISRVALVFLVLGILTIVAGFFFKF